MIHYATCENCGHRECTCDVLATSAETRPSDRPYVDKTGTDQKPNPMTDVYLEFPLAMMELARVTAYGAGKHAPRGWQTFDPEYGIRYHASKMGRHLLDGETKGFENEADGGLLHPAQATWNALAWLENILRQRERDNEEYEALKEEGGNV